MSEQGSRAALVRVTEGRRERVGRIGRDRLAHAQEQPHHVLDLGLFRAAAADHRLLDMPRHVLVERQLRLERRTNGGGARLPELQRAVGVAMDEYLLGLESASSVEGMAALSRAGHRIEHAEMLDARALATLVLHGVRLSVQPAFDAAWGGADGMYARRLGRVRASALNPFADLVSGGVPLALGSDAPVTPVDPWGTVRAGVYHHEAEQRITARAAFRAHTRGGWRLAGLDHTGAGELRVGSPAHLAVWRTDALVVQVPDGTVPTWSTDARAGTPLLPDLSDPNGRPECLRTTRSGVPLFDTFG